MPMSLRPSLSVTSSFSERQKGTATMKHPVELSGPYPKHNTATAITEGLAAAHLLPLLCRHTAYVN